MKSLLKIRPFRGALCGVVYLMSHAFLFADPMTQIQGLAIQMSAQEDAQTRLRLKLQETSTKISRLKKDLSRSASLFKQFRLDQLLKEAQDLANQIHQANKNYSQIQAKMQIEEDRLIKELDQKILMQTLRVKDKGLGIEERKISLARLQELTAEKEKRTSSVLPVVNNKEVMNLRGFQGELDQKIIAEMLKKDIQSEMLDVQKQMALLQKKSFVKAELENFFEEESFFSETGFVRANTTNKSQTGVLKVKDDKAQVTTLASDSQGNSVATNSAATVVTATTENHSQANAIITPPGSTTAVSSNVTTLVVPNTSVTDTALKSNSLQPAMSLGPTSLVTPDLKTAPTTNLLKDNHSSTMGIHAHVVTPSLQSVSPSMRVDSRDRVGIVNQDLSRTATNIRRRSIVSSQIPVGSEAKQKQLQERYDYLKKLFSELDQRK